MPERWRRGRFRCLQLLHLGYCAVTDSLNPKAGRGYAAKPSASSVTDEQLGRAKNPVQAELGGGTTDVKRKRASGAKARANFQRLGGTAEAVPFPMPA